MVYPREGEYQKTMREAFTIMLDYWKPGGPDDFDAKYWQVGKPQHSRATPTHHRCVMTASQVLIVVSDS